MEPFKEFVLEQESKKYRRFTFEAGEYFVHILYREGKDNLITEAQRNDVTLGGIYSTQLYQAYTFVDQKDLYVYSKSDRLFALNLCSTAHGRSAGISMPNKVARVISKQFPDYKLPENNIIEPAPEPVQVELKLIMLNEVLDSALRCVL